MDSVFNENGVPHLSTSNAAAAVLTKSHLQLSCNAIDDQNSTGIGLQPIVNQLEATKLFSEDLVTEERVREFDAKIKSSQLADKASDSTASDVNNDNEPYECPLPESPLISSSSDTVDIDWEDNASGCKHKEFRTSTWVDSRTLTSQHPTQDGSILNMGSEIKNEPAEIPLPESDHSCASISSNACDSDIENMDVGGSSSSTKCTEPKVTMKNASEAPWTMPDDLGEPTDIYLDRFFKFHFGAYETANPESCPDRSEHTDPVVLYNVTDYDEVYNKVKKVPGLVMCSAGGEGNGAVVLGWDDVAVWKCASQTNVSSYPKAWCMYILESARNFGAAMSSQLARSSPSTRSSELGTMSHFHGTYIVRWKDIYSTWDIRATLVLEIRPIPGSQMLEGTMIFGGKEWKMWLGLNPRQLGDFAITGDAKLHEDSGVNFNHKQLHYRSIYGKGIGVLTFDSGHFTSFLGVGSLPWFDGCMVVNGYQR